MNKPVVTPSSGNVFADIGLPDAPGELVKAELIYEICKRLQTMDLKQIAAGARLGLSQGDVSRLVNGRRAGFSTERLMEILTALNVDVDIVVRPLENETRVGTVRVERVGVRANAGESSYHREGWLAPRTSQQQSTRKEHLMSKDDLFIERRQQGDFAVRRPNSERASATAPTQAEAIARAKEISPDGAIPVERVRNTDKGGRDKWRKI